MSLLKIFAFFSLLFLFSCQAFLYGPDPMRTNTPTAKGDIKGTMGLNASTRYYGVLGEVSYSPINHIGTQLFFDVGNKKQSIGAAIGGYLGKYNVKDNGFSGFHFDGYLGYSINRIKSVDDYELGSSSFTYTKTFLYKYNYRDLSAQLGMHFNYKYVGIDLAYRPHVLDVTKINVYDEVNTPTKERILLLNNDPFYVHDIIGRLNFGTKDIGIYFAGSIAINNQDIADYISPYALSFGFDLNLATLLKN